MIYVFTAIGMLACIFAVRVAWSGFTDKPLSQLAPYKIEEYSGRYVIQGTDSSKYWEQYRGGTRGWWTIPGLASAFDSPEEALQAFSKANKNTLQLALVTVPGKSPACKLKLKFYNWLQKEC